MSDLVMYLMFTLMNSCLIDLSCCKSCNKCPSYCACNHSHYKIRRRAASLLSTAPSNNKEVVDTAVVIGIIDVEVAEFVARSAVFVVVNVVITSVIVVRVGVKSVVEVVVDVLVLVVSSVVAVEVVILVVGSVSLPKQKCLRPQWY
ncbi:MAG: hypothetical protein MRQ13_01840 [Candidatus Midichloria sp.]|nr:hypothetical protein [Candidatus Midichloria sp.]